MHIGEYTIGEIGIWATLAISAIASIVQIAPIRLNPWTSLARAIGRAINGEVLDELKNTKEKLEEHIRIDDQRDADKHRERILQFNNELLRDIRHTREDFIEILTEIDKYERYCREHPEYPNNRAVHAVANIGRVYDIRLQKHDFIGE